MNDQAIIEDYAASVAGLLVGTAQRKARVRSDLVDHLTGAVEADELAEALERLGSPEQAAASFAQATPMVAAPGPQRVGAAIIDNLPLVGVTIALFVRSLTQAGETFAAFPPFVYIRLGTNVCVGPLSLSIGNGCGAYDGAGLLYGLGVPLAIVWSLVVLGVVESRFATTPGKSLFGLCVVDEQGLRISARAGVVRRLSFVLGPLAWLDWLPFTMGRKHRLLDHVAGTRVVEVPVR